MKKIVLILLLLVGICGAADYGDINIRQGSNLSYVDGGGTTQTFDMATVPTDNYVMTYDSSHMEWSPRSPHDNAQGTIKNIIYQDGTNVIWKARNGTIIDTSPIGIEANYNLLQSALNDTADAHIYIAEGIYYVGTNTLLLPDESGFHLEGSGRNTAIYATGSQDIIRKLDGSVRTQQIIENILIRDTSGNDATGINMSQQSYADVRNIYIYDCDAGIIVPPQASVYYNSYYNIITRVYSYGMWIGQNSQRVYGLRVLPQGSACTGCHIESNYNMIFGLGVESSGSHVGINVSGNTNCFYYPYLENLDKLIVITSGDCNSVIGGKAAVATTSRISDSGTNTMFYGVRLQYDPICTIPSEAPFTEISGAQYYSPAENKLYIYDGTGWNYATLTTT